LASKTARSSREPTRITGNEARTLGARERLPVASPFLLIPFLPFESASPFESAPVRAILHDAIAAVIKPFAVSIRDTRADSVSSARLA
jgi:hypothetical protein